MVVRFSWPNNSIMYTAKTTMNVSAFHSSKMGRQTLIGNLMFKICIYYYGQTKSGYSGTRNVESRSGFLFGCTQFLHGADQQFV